MVAKGLDVSREHNSKIQGSATATQAIDTAIPAKVAVAAVMYNTAAELDKASKLTEREDQCTRLRSVAAVGLIELRDERRCSIKNCLIRYLQD